MAEGPEQRHSILRRRHLLIDPSLQLRLGLQLAGVFVVIATAYVLAIYVLFDQASMESLNADEVRSLFLRANLLYGSYALVALIGAGIWLLHGISGPAMVIERAVRLLADGDASGRLTLRPGDRLQTMAAAVGELRDVLLEDQVKRRQLLAELASRIEAGELESAAELLERLGHDKFTGKPS